MHSVIHANPFRCRMWRLHDRLDSHITVESCRAQLESVSSHGQLVPVLGRTLRDDPSADIELIYGARRLYIARHLNVPLLVEIRELSDREALIQMDIENRCRADLSPCERGRSYARWLLNKYFHSQDDIAQALHISSSRVSRLLKLARMPPLVIKAFGGPAGIREGWGLGLLATLADPRKKAAVMRRARAIARKTPRPAPGEVYRLLLRASAGARRTVETRRAEIVRDAHGRPLFRIRYQTDSVALVLPLVRLSSLCLENITCTVARALQEQRTANN